MTSQTPQPTRSPGAGHWLPPQLVQYAAMAAEADDGDTGDVPTDPTPASAAAHTLSTDPDLVYWYQMLRVFLAEYAADRPLLEIWARIQ